MTRTSFGLPDFGLRFLIAALLVTMSYNPTGYSVSHWLVNIFPKISPLFAVAFVILIGGWAIFIRATCRSLGSFGIVLVAALLAALIWLFWDWGLLSLSNIKGTAWIVNIALSLILAVGLSWSHVRRQITGQLDVDDVDA